MENCEFWIMEKTMRNHFFFYQECMAIHSEGKEICGMSWFLMSWMDMTLKKKEVSERIGSSGYK